MYQYGEPVRLKGFLSLWPISRSLPPHRKDDNPAARCWAMRKLLSVGPERLAGIVEAVGKKGGMVGNRDYWGSEEAAGQALIPVLCLHANKAAGRRLLSELFAKRYGAVIPPEVIAGFPVKGAFDVFCKRPAEKSGAVRKLLREASSRLYHRHQLEEFDEEHLPKEDGGAP